MTFFTTTGDLPMQIEIKDIKTISSLQEEFNALFPYLKIEFFTRVHDIGAPSPKKLIRHANKTIGECRTVHTEGNIIISPLSTVAQLEQSFRTIYGLSVQVFRRSGNVWLETTVTDSWTLADQNEQGESLTKYIDGRNKDGIIEE